MVNILVVRDNLPLDGGRTNHLGYRRWRRGRRAWGWQTLPGSRTLNNANALSFNRGRPTTSNNANRRWLPFLFPVDYPRAAPNPLDRGAPPVLLHNPSLPDINPLSGWGRAGTATGASRPADVTALLLKSDLAGRPGLWPRNSLHLTLAQDQRARGLYWTTRLLAPHKRGQARVGVVVPVALPYRHPPVVTANLLEPLIQVRIRAGTGATGRTRRVIRLAVVIDVTIAVRHCDGLRLKR